MSLQGEVDAGHGDEALHGPLSHNVMSIDPTAIADANPFLLVPPDGGLATPLSTNLKKVALPVATTNRESIPASPSLAFWALPLSLLDMRLLECHEYYADESFAQDWSEDVYEQV